MSLMRAVTIIMVTFCVIFLSFLNILGTRTDAVKGVTIEKIKSIKVGISEEQVVKILGFPYDIYVYSNLTSYSYTKPVLLSKHYPMLSVQFNSEMKVSNVLIKRFDGILKIDDLYIYNLAATYDSVNNRWVPYIDERRFSKCFK